MVTVSAIVFRCCCVAVGYSFCSLSEGGLYRAQCWEFTSAFGGIAEVGSAAGPRSFFRKSPGGGPENASATIVDAVYFGLPRMDVYCDSFMRYACCLKPAAHASGTAYGVWLWPSPRLKN